MDEVMDATFKDQGKPSASSQVVITMTETHDSKHHEQSRSFTEQTGLTMTLRFSTNSTPRLHHLVKQGCYDEALVYVKENVDDLGAVDAAGNTALHLLVDSDMCTNVVDCPQANKVVHAIVRARPDLVAASRMDGMTPLHLCVRRHQVHERGSGLRILRSPTAVVLALIRANPGAVTNMVNLSKVNLVATPFHVACQADADIGILKAMLAVNPSFVSQQPRVRTASQNEETPAEVLWQSNPSAMDKLALILVAAFKGRVDYPLLTDELVHAACCHRCPETFASSIVTTFTAQASQRDAQGNFPLHYAVRKTSSHVHGVFLEQLLSVFPEAAAIPDNNGQLPLNVALTSHTNLKKCTISKFVAANPDALYILDVRERLYPALIAASCTSKGCLHLSVTFDLLREAPDIVSQALRTNI